MFVSNLNLPNNGADECEGLRASDSERAGGTPDVTCIYSAITSLHNRPLLFISLSHSDNQSESATKFYNSFKADVEGNVLTLT